jgi:hypothetical protein
MRSSIATTLAIVTALAGAARVVADTPVVIRDGQQMVLSLRDVATVNACADAFIAKIAPGTAPLSHVALPPANGSAAAANRHLEVTLEARSAAHGVLATATCEATLEAQVMHLYAAVLQPQVVAGLSRQQLRDTLVARL